MTRWLVELWMRTSLSLIICDLCRLKKTVEEKRIHRHDTTRCFLGQKFFHEVFSNVSKNFVSAKYNFRAVNPLLFRFRSARSFELLIDQPSQHQPQPTQQNDSDDSNNSCFNVLSCFFNTYVKRDCISRITLFEAIHRYEEEFHMSAEVGWH